MLHIDSASDSSLLEFVCCKNVVIIIIREDINKADIMVSFVSEHS